jgi:hypothetical protein
MNHESRPGQAARGETTITTNDHSYLTASLRRPASPAKCEFCSAPALKPNRRERRRFSSVPWVMQHATWCRVYGDGRPVYAGSPKPNGGAAR